MVVSFELWAGRPLDSSSSVVSSLGSWKIRVLRAMKVTKAWLAKFRGEKRSSVACM